MYFIFEEKMFKNEIKDGREAPQISSLYKLRKQILENPQIIEKLALTWTRLLRLHLSIVI